MDFLSSHDKAYLKHQNKNVQHAYEEHLKARFNLDDQVKKYIEESEFLDKFPKQKFKKGHHVIYSFKHHHDCQRTVGFIHKGQCKIVMDQASVLKDYRPTIGFIGQHKWIGHDSINSFANLYSYVALTPCEVSLIPVDWMLEIAPRFLLNHLLMSSLLAGQSTKTEGLMTKKMPLAQRTLETLYAIYLMFEDQNLSVTREEMAFYMGVGRQYLPPILSDFEKQGLIDIRRGKIIIVDPDRLFDSFLNYKEEQITENGEIT